MKKNTISTGADLQQAEPHSTEESMDQTMQNTSVGSNADVTPNDTVEGSTVLAEPVSSTGESSDDDTSSVRIIKEFLEQNYEFRNNVLSGKIEFRLRDDPQSTFRTLTREAENSIILRACLELEKDKGVKTNVQLIIHSEETPKYDLIKEYLGNLPKWDGVNRVAELFGRLPGITSEQILQCTIWFRSAVAHWLQLDLLHGNETVPTLIGDQGCGKTVFCRRLLPPHLQQYFLDHMNFSNKFDKDMALSNNLIVVLDELNQYKTGQQAQLKQALSKCNVNGRPIFGTVQQDRHRFASFLATTNNPHPLTDPTGSRRYLCIRITPGVVINNDLPIDYAQLYAQLVEEVCERKLRYWFTPDEARRIQDANVPFQRIADVDEMVEACFRHPKTGEVSREYTMKEIIAVIIQQYPLLKINHGMKVRVGTALKRHGFVSKQHTEGIAYVLVPRLVA